MSARRRLGLREAFTAIAALVAVMVWAFFHGDANESSELIGRLRSLPIPAIPEERTLLVEWPSIQTSLTGPIISWSSNACNRGDSDCVPAVVDEMARRLRPLAETCSHRAPFLLMYMRVTEGVATASDVAWDDRAFLNHLDAVFAQQYFHASDAWDAGRTDEVPEAWRIAFESADERSVNGVGDVLLGMNAHISRDLPFALLEVGLSNGTGGSAERDFREVDRVLASAQRAVVEEVAARFDAAVAATALPRLGVASLISGKGISEWREQAWEDAVRLVEAEGGTRAAVAAEIESIAATRAERIRAFTSYGAFGSERITRQHYCESL